VAAVKSTNNDVLMGLGDRPGADMTKRLLLALTALYVQRPIHTAEEQRQYIELALRLIDEIDEATRITVAGILQRCPDAPAVVFERLGGTISSLGGGPKGTPHASREQRRADGERRVYDLTDLYHGLDRGAAHNLLASWRAQAELDDAASEPKPDAGKPAGPRGTSVAGLRARFGALTERLKSRAVNVRPGPGSAARRDLRSR
jgi:hypothetical protein